MLFEFSPPSSSARPAHTQKLTPSPLPFSPSFFSFLKAGVQAGKRE